MRKILLGLCILGLIPACTDSETNRQAAEVEYSSNPSNKVLLSSEIQWEQLNPARGDKSPQAGTIWGDRKGEVATGFLAKFVDGFSSPPHIHNVSYRALVIKGLIHNDDPNAENMWMPPTSFWTQPAGEAHITSAQGEENIAYVEIDSGPYLVKPTEEAFDNGERPVNIDAQNLVWLYANQSQLIKSKGSGLNPEIAFLWKKNGLSGYLLKMPAGYKGSIISEGEEFRSIVIAGESNYTMPVTKEIKSLDPGSYVSSTGKAKHEIEVHESNEAFLYIRSNGKISIKASIKEN